MQFIIDNYIWFIVGAIVIVMAIIGYIADKTDFGRTNIGGSKEPKVKKEKKNKKEKVVKEPEKIEVEDKGISDFAQSMVELPQEEKEPLQENMEMQNDVVEDIPTIATETQENLYTPTEEMEEYLPLEPLSTEEIASDESIDTPKEEEPTLETEENIPLEPFPEEIELQPLSPVTIEEPVVVSEEVEEPTLEEPVLENIEPTEIPVEFSSDAMEESEDDDIWKF